VKILRECETRDEAESVGDQLVAEDPNYADVLSVVGPGNQLETTFEHVPGHRVEARRRVDGLLAVSLLPDAPGPHGHSAERFVSSKPPPGFPAEYDAVPAWGRDE
jgi:hypothetical protein